MGTEHQKLQETEDFEVQEQETQAKKCPKCGRIQPIKNAKFCLECGAELKEPSDDIKENSTKRGKSVTSLIVWFIILLLLVVWSKINHQNWVAEQMEHFRGTDYTYSDKEIQRELDKILNTFGR